MQEILIDSSVWIDYFKYGKNGFLDDLIREDFVVTNEIILTELIPYCMKIGQHELVESLQSLPLLPLNIDWQIIQLMQFKNLENGINGVGIPDLIILQQVIDRRIVLWTADKHFYAMQACFNFELFDYK